MVVQREVDYIYVLDCFPMVHYATSLVTRGVEIENPGFWICCILCSRLMAFIST